jgi:ketosteroid isomerase-like protein
MPAYTPEQVHDLFAEYFSADDLDKLMTLYEPGATMLPQPGPQVTGEAAIREVLSGFLALKGQMILKVARTIQGEDIAILFSNWTLNGTDPNGGPVALAGQTSDVVRRQADGSWLFVIDNPFGAAAAS